MLDQLSVWKSCGCKTSRTKQEITSSPRGPSMGPQDHPSPIWFQ